MKKKACVLFAVLMLAALGLPASPALASDYPTVAVDVTAANGDYGDYTIDDDAIVLAKPETFYELSGSTDKQVSIDNTGSQESEVFRVRLNNATLSGGIVAQTKSALSLELEVPSGTSNYVDSLNPLALYIHGSGTLETECLNVGPNSAIDALMSKSVFYVQDTQIQVTRDAQANASCRWMGDSVLYGNASVTIISNGNYAPLRVSSSNKDSAALTIRDNAKLYCLHANADEPTPTGADGLQVQRGGLVVQDSGYLEAEGRPSEYAEDDGGCAVFCGEGIWVMDNARVVANGAGWAMSSGVGLTVSGPGARVKAHGKNNYGIYLEGGMEVDSGARVEVSSKLAAIWFYSNVTVTDATLVASSESEETFSSGNDTGVAVDIENSLAQLSAAQGRGIFPSNIDATITGSWIDLPLGNDVDAAITDSVVYSGKNGTVVGAAKTLGDTEIKSDETLTIPAGASLTVASGTTFTNNGTVAVLGTFDGSNGTVVCNSHSGGTATCTAHAVCDLCHTEYGEFDTGNHAHGLTRVDAKAATATTEGNIAHWYCPDCGRCFSDESATSEVSQADTVVSKLTGKKASSGKKAYSKRGLPATGDASLASIAAAALLGGIALVGAAGTLKRS